MDKYFDTVYFRDEFGERSYPQKLCDHLIARLINPHFKRDTTCMHLLDIGHGKGSHLFGFLRRGFEVSGLDKRIYFQQDVENIELKQCDIEKENFPFPKSCFDIAFSKSVLEHIANSDHFLAEIYRILKPGGIAIVMTPDWGSQYKSFWNDHTHVKAWTRKGLQNALDIHGFDNTECTLFRQLPVLWRFPFLTLLSDITALLPESFKWKDKEERLFRKWIRFSKEKMLLAKAVKPFNNS